MPRERRRGKEASGRQAPGPRAPDRAILLLPALVAVVLNLPCLGLGYLWDDFYFLTFKGRGDLSAYLLPDPGAAFYRPIPLGVYFKVLRFLDPANGLAGHLLNLAALVAAVALLTALVARLSGPRAGLFAGLLFASCGAVPGLVAWVSCSQDLLAILFIAAAFVLRHRGNGVAALACAAAGLLCKETALAAFPALVLWDWIVGRAGARPWRPLAGYGAVAVAWALVHPGIHLLAGHGFKSGATGYVGIEHSERWGLYLARYVMTVLNLPPPGLLVSWWDDRGRYGLAALAVLAAGLWRLDRSRKAGGSAAGTLPIARAATLGALVALPGLLMPALLVRHWAPYFACIPAVGIAILLAPLLARLGRIAAIAALAAFLLLGVWCRGVRAEHEWVLSETAMAEASSAVRTVRANFRTLFPAFPKGSQVALSVATRGIRGIQSALLEGQALSLWYGDPTLRAVAARERRPGAPADFLVRVTNDLDVIAIDPGTLGVRSTMPGSPGLAEIDPPVNDYARAVAAGGETDRAIRVMEGLSRMESGDLVAYNRRLIASMLLAAGRRGEADSVLAATPPFPKEVAQALVLRLVAGASASERLDAAAFEAFGLSERDPQTIRWIARELRKDGATAQAAWWARTLGELEPGDPESAAILAEAARRGVPPRREPAPRLSARPDDRP